MKPLSKTEKIAPHEPEEQLVDVNAAFRDADRMMQERKRIKQERLKAKLDLKKMGLTLLEDERLGPEHIRFVHRKDGSPEAVRISIADFQRLVTAFGIMDAAAFSAAVKAAKQTK